MSCRWTRCENSQASNHCNLRHPAGVWCSCRACFRSTPCSSTRSSPGRTSFAIPFSLPWPLEFEGYQTAWSDGRFDLYFRNSIFVTLTSLLLIVFLGSLAAYALANWRSRWSTVLYLFFVAGLMIPIRLGTINIFQIIQALGLTDTVFSLIPVYVAMGLPIAVFVLDRLYPLVAARPDRRRPRRRRLRVAHLLVDHPAADPAGPGHGDHLQPDPHLERPLVPADLHPRRRPAHGYPGRLAALWPVPEQLDARPRRALPFGHTDSDALPADVQAVHQGLDGGRRQRDSV